MSGIYLVNLAEVTLAGEPLSAELLMPWLPTSSREKLRKISVTSARLQSAAGEILARYAVCKHTGLNNSEINIQVGPKGKPFIAGAAAIQFNLSHSGKYVACIVYPGKAGIDIERVRSVNYRVAERYFTNQEYESMQLLDEPEKLRHFFVLWTLKESFLKAIGTGLTRSLGSFTVVRDNETFKLLGNRTGGYRLFTYIPDKDYRLSVCVKGKAMIPHPQEIFIDELLKRLDKFQEL